MIEVKMPRLSDSMEEGTILRGIKPEGEEVAVGDELVEIETDKANMVYEADGSGILSFVAHEGDTVPVGALIARLLSSSEEKPNGAPAPTAALFPKAAGGRDPGGSFSPSAPRSTAVPALNFVSAADMASGGDGRVKPSPVARRIAHELGRDGEITTAHLMPVTLAGDHRILYGAEGAELLARIRTLLEEPGGLAL